MIYPETFEDKIGFTAIRHELSANCSGEKGKEYAEAMRFSTDPEEIILALERTAEMLSILTSGEGVPAGWSTQCGTGIDALPRGGRLAYS